MGLSGSKFICETVVLTQEIANINEALILTVEHLKNIVWQVNTKVKDRREAIPLSRDYTKAVKAWLIKINQVVMTKEQGKRRKSELKIAG